MFSNIWYCAFEQLYSTIWSNWSAGFLWKNRDFNRKHAAIAGEGRSWFEVPRTWTIVYHQFKLRLYKFLLSCNLSDIGNLPHLLWALTSHQLLNNRHPPQHMGNAACTPLLSLPTAGTGDPAKMACYTAQANDMYYPTIYPEPSLPQQQITKNPSWDRGLQWSKAATFLCRFSPK